MTTPVDVLIVGAGFAGIGAGIRLQREGRHSFVIVERAAKVGGTWRDNRYPGVACDVPSHLYSYSFRPKPDWSRIFAPGGEIFDYLRAAVRDEGLEPRLRLGTEVVSMRWNDERESWDVVTTSGTFEARAVVMAAGRLAEPVLSDVAGLDGFEGRVVHSARWPADLDLSGKRVGVVGTGSSAAQIVPHVADVAEQLVVFQRTPSWVIPRADRAFTDDEHQFFENDRRGLETYRSELFDTAERGFAARAKEPAAIGALRDLATGHREAQISDEGLRAALTPDYEIGCKRVVISDEFYPALGRANVVLEASALSSVAGSIATASSGATHELDVLIFATGFNSTRPPYAEFVVGRGGVVLADHWSGGMTAFASTVVSGFPNFFVLNGPNATLGHNSAIHVIESQIGYLLGALDHLASGERALDVSGDAEREYVATIDALSASTVWMTGGCASWYLDERSARLTLVWPGTATAFRERNGTFDPAPFATDSAPREGALSPRRA